MRKNLPFNDQFNANAIALKRERNKRALISRVIIVILILILKIGISYSQISYTSARTTGITYTSISSTGTSFAGWRNGTSTDDNLSNSTPIGFNFYYDGAYRTTFSVSTNGFITFNTGTTEIGSGTGAYGYSNTAFSASTATSAQSVAPMYDDLQTKNNPVTAASLASSIKYKLSGTVPNRVLTIEWIAMEYYGSSGENINLQIKLNETTNIIEFWYGTMSPGSATYTYTSGLNSLTISSTPLVTELYTQQTANTATFSNIASNSLATIPAANTKIVFTPPAVCSGTPVAGTATATTSSFCASGSTTVTLTGYSSGVAGISFQWQNSTDGGTTWNNISGATSSTYTTPTLTSTTKYLCVVKCNSSGLTANSSIATININTAPVISCPSNISANTAAGTCGAVVTYAATATGSPAPAITYSVNSGSTFNLGTTTVTATATNSCGTSACSFTVTVTDNINPSITAPATISVNTNSGCAATGVALGTPVTADNCTVASVTNNAPSTFPLGNTTVTWTVTDGSGHTATAAQTVTVTDNINPTITAPANVSVNTNSGCAATGVVLGTPVTADNCAVASVTNNAPSTFPLGNTIVTWTVTDGSGHTATAAQVVTVTDNINPTITAPVNVSVNTNSGCTATGVALGTPVTADNCTVASVTNNAPTTFPLGNTTVTWTVTDGSGHTAIATQTVTVIDNINPTITAPATISAHTNSGCAATGVALGTPVTADNCTVASVTNNSPATFPLGNTIVTWTVTDGSGHIATAAQTVTVTDNINPTIIAPANVSVNTNSGCVATGVALGTPVTADNCTVASVTNNAPATFPLGNTIVTWTVTDGSGHTATATQTVTVTDNINPTIIAPATISVNTNSGCSATGVALGTPVTADNCTVASVTNNAPSTFPLGNTTVTWTVTDGSGHTATASQTVTVIDNINPTIIAPANVSVNTNSGCAATGVALGTPVTADNCTVASVTNNAPSTFPLGNTIVTWTVTDGSGHTATAAQTVTVTDNINPTITAPANVSVNTNSGCSATSVALGTPVTADNCTVASVTNNAPATFPLGNTIVTWTVTDGSGHTATASQTVTVIDNINPTITAPATISAHTNSGCSATGVTLGTPVTADNCTVASVTNNAPSTFPLGNTTVTWTVTDGSGHIATAAQTVTVTDNINPTIIAPAAISATPASGACTVSGLSLGTPVTTDNCGVASVTNNSPSAFPVGITTVTWTVTDNSGNIATANQTVTISASSVNYWTGSISNDWFNNSNWCSGIPTASTDVQIPSGAVNMPLINNINAVCRNLTINSGATLSIITNGNISIKGNLVNNGTFSSTGGVVNFNGTSAQTITGVTSFYEMDLNNASGLTLGTSSNLIIHNVLQLINGKITTNANIVTIADSSSVLVTNGYVNGYLKKHIYSGSFITQTFEVGSAAAYTPVTLIFNQAYTTGYLTMNTISSDHPSIATSGFNSSKTVNRYWNVTNSGVTFDFYNIELDYAAADKDPGFIDIYAGAKIYTASGTWSTTTQSNIGTNSVSVENATVFGCIQIGIFNPVPVTASVNPDHGYIGQTMNIVFNGSGFISGVSSVNTVPGVTINSTTINNDSTLTLNVSISATAALGIRKFAITNCAPAGGTSDSLSFTILGHPVASFFANYTAITCNISGNVEFNNYTTNGSTYYWDFGAGASPATATGTGPYTVTYSTTGLKTVRLIAFSPIGNDTLTKVNYINVTANAPAVAASISGPTSVCSYGTSNVVYSTPLVIGVSSYTWTVPAAVTIVSGQGTRNLIVSFGSSFSSGNISVTESNGCGTSAAKSLAVTKTPAAPSTITGPAVICGLSSATYTVAAATGATSYTWTLPSGVTSSLGTSPVTTTSLSITVNFTSTFTSGNLSVISNNSCSSSAAKTIALTKTPPVPGVITGVTSICGLTTATYSVALVSGATGYTWTSPAGVTILSGQGTNSITVSIIAAVGSGNLSVVSTNACTTSAARTLALTGCHAYTQATPIDSTVVKAITTTLYPNPTSGNFNIQYNSEIDSKLIIEMYDVEGKIVFNRTEAVVTGQNSFNYNEEEVKKGIYFIRILDENNNISETKKLLVQ